MNYRTLLGIGLICILSGCGGNEERLRSSGTPVEAADHLTEAFENASAQTKKNAGIASEAMRKGEYGKALVALESVKNSSPTFEQGIAVNDSLISLEHELISQMANGDPNARQAYQILKRVNQN